MNAVFKYYPFPLQTLYNGLKELLSYEDEDMEETFMQTFKICYQDVFGSVLFHELKEGGEEIYVSQDNKVVSNSDSRSVRRRSV